MNSVSRFWSLCAILVLLVGCTGNPSPLLTIPGASSTATAISSNAASTVTPLLTKTASPTKMVSPSVTMTSAPTATATGQPRTNCLEILDQFPSGLTSEGYLILESWENQEDGSTHHKIYSLNLATMELAQMNQPDEHLIYFAVSPDGKQIALYLITQNDGKQPSRNEIVIRTVDGQTMTSLPWEKGWGRITAWLDNQRLVIEIPSDIDPRGEPSTLLVLNPFTGERKYLKSDYPNIYSFPPVMYWEGWGETVYDPTLSRVVYLRGGDNKVPGPIYYVLWNVETKQDLIQFSIVGDLNVVPRWSPDGQQFAFSPKLFSEDVQKKQTAYEILAVSRDGVVTQLTHLTDYYPWIYISDLSWAPDAKSIAFWFSSWNEKPDYSTFSEQQLAILNTLDRGVINYCIPGDFAAQLAGLRRVPPPLWSPDGRQIIVLSRKSDISSRVILVDLEKEIAVRIAEDMIPIGWMIQP